MKIEKGSTRTVFVFRNYVLKIPTLIQYNLFLHGLLANLQEKMCSGIRDDLARVYWCDRFGFFLIMQKVEVISNNIDWSEFKDLLTNRYQDDELKEFMLSDLKPCNWGYIQDKLVKIDYDN